MGEITFGGLATGLPTEDLISSFLEVDKQPLNRLNATKTEESEKLKAYKQYDVLLDKLKESVSGLNLTSDARTTSIDLSDEDHVAVESNGAATGNHTISVVQLAQVQKTVTDGVSSQSDAIFSEGTISIGDVGIVIDENNNSLSGMMNAINATSDETGVTASIINDGSESNNYHIVLTGKDASTSFSFANDLKVTEDDTEVSFSADHTSIAQQAVAIIDGIEVVSNSNKINDAVAGLDITLKEVSEMLTPASGETKATYAYTTIEVEPDTDALKEKITGFVTAYNEAMNWIVEGYEYTEDDDDTDTSSSTSDDDDTEENLSHLLRGDSTINKVKRDLQNMLVDSNDNSSKFQILAELGIQTQQDGTLLIKAATLDENLADNYNDVVSLLAGDESNDGIMDKLNDSLIKHTSATQGMYALKEDTHDSRLTSLDKQIEQQNSRLETIELRYRSQFTALELLVSSMNNEATFISNFFSSMTSNK
ncbi:MAG: flagellar filament capping protein FliD [Desulfotalea sp.]